MIDPNEVKELVLVIGILEKNESAVRIDSKLDSSDGVCFKFRGKYKIH